MPSLETHLARIFVTAIKEDDQENIIRSFKHYKRRSDNYLMDKHVEAIYINYFRNKYEFNRMKCN